MRQDLDDVEAELRKFLPNLLACRVMRPQAAVRWFKNVAFAAHPDPSPDHAPDMASIMDQSTKPVWPEAMGVVA